MVKYRKKPVVIDAVEIQPENYRALHALAERSPECSLLPVYGDDGRFDLPVRTLEGVMRGERGDFLILGVKNELYPCKPDIFAATYEQVD